MSFLAKVTSFVGGGIFKEAKDLIQDYWPPDMSPEKKAELSLKLDEAEQKKTALLYENAADAEKTLNERINQQEGTAKDLLQLPIIGRIVLFLRGVQRPAWGFFTMYIDYVWFTSPSSRVVDGMVVSLYSEQQQTALIVINALVLGFLFGERTFKNLEPLLVKIWGK